MGRRLTDALGRGVLAIVLWLLEHVSSGDLVTIGGAIVLWYGIAQLSRPIAAIVLGALMIWYGLPTRPPFVQSTRQEKQ